MSGFCRNSGRISSVYRLHIFFHADLAHLVERHLAKVEVASSSLVIRSKFFFRWYQNGSLCIEYIRHKNGAIAKW